MSITASTQRKLYEVAPYSVLLPLTTMLCGPVVNAGFFNKLPKELQEILVDTALEVEKMSVHKALEVHAEAAHFLTEKGYPPYKPSKEEMLLWIKGIQPIRESVVQHIPQGVELLKKIDSLLKR